MIRQRCGVVLAIRTVGKYLARWGFTTEAVAARLRTEPGRSAVLAAAGLPGYRGGGPSGARHHLLG